MEVFAPLFAFAVPRVLPVDVPAGTVTVYSSRLWHRGGANGRAEGEAPGENERAFAFLTIGEPGAPAPAGLIHTMARGDVGRWLVSSDGMVERSG